MKNSFKFLMMSVVIFASFYKINAMEKEAKESTDKLGERAQSRSDGSRTSRTLNKGGSSSQELIKNKMVHNALNTSATLSRIIGIECPPSISSGVQIESRSTNSLNSPSSKFTSTSVSPRKSLRPVHHLLVLFGQDRLPMLKINIGNLVSDCQESFCQTLKKYNVEVFVVTEAEDENALDQDCDYKVAKVLNELNIVETIVHPKTVDEFINITNQYFNKVISVYGLSNNGMLYTMLVCASIPIAVQKAINRLETFLIYEKQMTIKDVLTSRIGLDQLVAHLLDAVYKRVFVHDAKHEFNPSDYLSIQEKEMIKNFCIEELLKYKNVLKDLY